MVDIIFDRIVGYDWFLFASERICQFVWVGQSTDAGSHDVDEFFQIIVFAYVIAILDILDVGFVEQRFQKAYFLLFGFIRQYLRKSAIQHIFIESCLHGSGISGHVLLKAQRVHFYLKTASAKLRNNIFGQKLCVTAGYIDIHIPHLQKTV